MSHDRAARGWRDVSRPGASSLARLSIAQAGFIRDSAEVYKLATVHLVR